MASTILKLTDYDQDMAHFESFNERIHIRTQNVDDCSDGTVCSIDKAAARTLALWLRDTIGPDNLNTNPTLIEEEEPLS